MSGFAALVVSTFFEPLMYVKIIQGLDIKSQECVQQKADEMPLHLFCQRSREKKNMAEANILIVLVNFSAPQVVVGYYSMCPCMN